MTREEAAEFLATTERHIRTLTWEGKLAYVKLGKKIRYTQEDLIAYRDSCRVEVGERPPPQRHGSRRSAEIEATLARFTAEREAGLR